MKRREYFSDEFMKKNFGEQHLEAFPTETAPPKGGYPDTGCGYYSRKMEYKDWFFFNLSQRVHQNFNEQVTIVLFVLLFAGVFYPLTTVGLGLMYSVGRFLMWWGYSKSVHGRLVGVVVLNIACGLTLILCIVGWAQAASGNSSPETEVVASQ
mmetsp:Transcript_45260/g.33039  ORF Transcript_45260/g.33039 Transcript_45260/m.33039 type:complete len:153 (+) Transcript_45260:131-589(+)|eukprot:CAMPEP_0202964062 /NCGR_PEP_ID=MMETSP1396-20130829/8129_1 /ASSEMBLY_ACC=CAM_ASM_000872 /TAXON_ID= /ORGANISM="Pseudokeronopsis sp., Strain Brazil" /LENGTH=152 /DNA_ID=CAMNT_0049685853 /DNA_START=121 /DNA_END=579 /DNA_ORIENTATION=+